MRYVLTGLLGAALLFGCGDDSGGDNPADTGVKDSGVRDAGSKDAGAPMDASMPALDSGTKDSGSTPLDSSVSGAMAVLASKSGSMVAGSATFTVSGGLVTLKLNVTHAEPGLRGVHIHQTGNCDAADGSSAGGHWNPDMHNHGSGAPDAGATSHLGDLGNIMIGADGAGTLTHSNPEWKLGDGSPMDVVGKAIVVHKNTDDLVTNTSDAGPGMSGARLACGVITK